MGPACGRDGVPGSSATLAAAVVAMASSSLAIAAAAAICHSAWVLLVASCLGFGAAAAAGSCRLSPLLLISSCNLRAARRCFTGCCICSCDPCFSAPRSAIRACCACCASRSLRRMRRPVAVVRQARKNSRAMSRKVISLPREGERGSQRQQGQHVGHQEQRSCSCCLPA